MGRELSIFRQGVGLRTFRRDRQLVFREPRADDAHESFCGLKESRNFGGIRMNSWQCCGPEMLSGHKGRVAKLECPRVMRERIGDFAQ